MPAVVFSGNNVKALKSNLDLNGVTSILSVNADPASGAGVAAPLGSIAMDYLAGKVYKKTGSLATEWQELGAGLGGINYIENPDAESGTAGWSTYADAAGSAPVDGTGGTANITWSRSTTSPLRGVADFNLVKDAVNRQGQGVSYDFTIDSADQAKILTISADYEVISGTFATGDLAVYIIQDPAGTPVVLQPAGYQVTAGTNGNKLRLAATFQTASNVTSYRLCLHVSTVSASAYTLALDSIAVSPQQVVYGAPVTDWVSYTPVITNLGTGTTSSSFGKWRRVGDSIEIEFRWQKDGSAGTGAGTVTMSLPTGLTIDSSKLPNSVNAPSGQLYVSGGATVFMPAVDPTGITFFNQTSAAQVTGSQVAANSNWVGSVNNVPILGWSSSVVVSSSTDTRVVDFVGYITSNTALTANTTQIPLTTVKDSHGAWSTNQYTVPVAGDYCFNITAQSSAATTNSIFVYVGGTQRAFVSRFQGNTISTGSVVIPNLVAGDVVSFRSDLGITVLAGSATSYLFTIHRLSGPSQIAASETVAARVYNNSGFSVPNNSVTAITGWTKSFDTHGSFNASTGVFTVPVSGKYRVSGMILFAAAGFSVGQPFSLLSVQAGSVSSNWVMGETWAMTTNTSAVAVCGSETIQCNAGDTITISAFQSQGGPRALAVSATENHVDIQRIGN